MMRDYELMFEVSTLTPALEDAIYERFNALVATHGNTTTLVILASGTDAVSAAETAILRLRNLGVRVIRLMDDLATRTEIAERADVTTQAVGLWVRGERNCETFPEPYIRAGNATLWLWGEVVEYLRKIGKEIDASILYPSRDDILAIASILASPKPGSADYKVFVTHSRVIPSFSRMDVPFTPSPILPRWETTKATFEGLINT